MMKPPFKPSDGAINVIHAPWFDTCTVWFVASLSYINMTLKSILVMSCPLVQYEAYNHAIQNYSSV